MISRIGWRFRFALIACSLGIAVVLASCSSRPTVTVSPSTSQSSPTTETIGSTSTSSAQPITGPLFEDVTKNSGIKFSYNNGEEAGYFALLESLGGGAAVFDFDGDGLMDIFVPGGGHFQEGVNAYKMKEMKEFLEKKKTDPSAKLPPPPQIHGYPGKLFRNKGNFQFEDVTEKVGLKSQPDFYSQGVAVCDYDRDGWPDLLVTGYGRVVLYHNEPDGKGGRKFVDVTEKAGLLGANPAKLSEESGQPGEHFWSTSAAWGDLDGDGYPDLYLCQYCNWSFAKNHPPCIGYKPGVEFDLCPPKEFGMAPHALWRNNGDGTFTNVTREAGLRVERTDKDYGKGLGVMFLDVDGDGKPDIYVCNDTTQNFLYLNRSTPGHMKFEDKGAVLGVAYDGDGLPNGSMGVDGADYNNSGRPSIWVTNYENEYNALYKNILIKGRTTFQFSTAAAGLGATGPNFVAFGTKFVDIDNDGWEDIVITNGHIVYFPPRNNVAQIPIAFRNVPSDRKPGPGESARKFEDITGIAGPFFKNVHRGRGLAVGDFDNDGRIDLVFVPVNEPVTILRNVAEPQNGWLGVELHGKDHRDLVGTRLTLDVDGRKLVRYIKGGTSYLCAHDQRIVFGLGQSKKAGKLTVEWATDEPKIQEFDNLEPGKYHKLNQK
jgi:hypothetical protein